MSHVEIIRQIKTDLSKGVFEIDALENRFKGKTALVISAGPSAERWTEVYEQEKENNPVIVCVKQTINLIDIPCDIHFLNSANLSKYRYQPNTLSIMTSISDAAPLFGSYDILFKNMEGFNYKPKYYLVNNNCFDCYTLNKTGVYRPKGPGIMHETVLFTLVHMGFSRIVTIGWDIADTRGSNSHVGQGDDGHLGEQYKPSKLKKTSENLLKKFLLLEFYKKLGFIRRYIKTWMMYVLNKKINLAGMEPNEADMIAKNIPFLKNWLNDKNVDLIIHSNSKWMSRNR